MAVSGSRLRDIKPELSAAFHSQGAYVTIFKIICTIPFSWRHLTDRFYPICRHSRVRKAVIVFRRKKSWEAGKNLRSYILSNWKFCFHFVSPCFHFFHPSLSYSLLFHFVGCLCGWPITLFEFLFPIKSRVLWSFEEWQAHSRKDQSNAKLKFKRKLKSM